MWKILLVMAIIIGAGVYWIKTTDVKPDPGPTLGYGGYTKGLIRAEQKAKEVMHQDNLEGAKAAVEKYHGEKGVYPPSLQDCVDAGYLDRVPQGVQYDPSIGQVSAAP